VLRGARTLAYLCDMSRVLRSVRLASDLPRNVFQQPAKACSLFREKRETTTRRDMITPGCAVFRAFHGKTDTKTC
jgi:hypothetical protein